MNKYCNNCKKEIHTKTIKTMEEYDVLGDKIAIESNVLVCPECGQHIFDEKIDGKTLKNVYDIYKQKHNLLSSKDIVEIRNKYGLSQRGLSRLLKWGDKTIFRYENGSIQDTSHNFVLESLKDEKNMLEYLRTNKDIVDEKLVDNILKNIESNVSINDFDYEDLFNYEPSEYSGYKRFDYKKACDMIRFFVDKFGKIQSTKLLKLMSYSDMLYFKENAISISGIRYKHYTYGPIPENHDLILHNMIENRILKESFEFLNDYEYHYYMNNANDCKLSLNKEELEVLEYIYNKFKDFGSKEISDYSHNERGYKETNTNEYISYSYANDMELELS